MYSINATSTPRVMAPASNSPAAYHSTSARERVVTPSTREKSSASYRLERFCECRKWAFFSTNVRSTFFSAPKSCTVFIPFSDSWRNPVASERACRARKK